MHCSLDEGVQSDEGPGAQWNCKECRRFEALKKEKQPQRSWGNGGTKPPPDKEKGSRSVGSRCQGESCETSWEALQRALTRAPGCGRVESNWGRPELLPGDGRDGGLRSAQRQGAAAGEQAPTWLKGARLGIGADTGAGF